MIKSTKLGSSSVRTIKVSTSSIITNLVVEDTIQPITGQFVWRTQFSWS